MIEFTKDQLKTEAPVHRRLEHAFMYYENQIVNRELVVKDLKTMRELREILKEVFTEEKVVENKLATYGARCCGCLTWHDARDLKGDLKLCKNCIDKE